MFSEVTWKWRLYPCGTCSVPTKRIVSLRAQSDSWGKHRQGYANFTKAIFRPIKRLKLIVRWFLERTANLYLVLSRKNNETFCSVGVSPLQFSVRTSQELDFRLITTSKNNFTEIHISRPTPWDSLCVSLLFIALSYHCHSEIMTESCEVFVTFESFEQILKVYSPF